MRHLATLSALTLALAASISGCGGGGGGGSASSPGTGVVTPPPVSTGTGLVPAPGTLGATLYADASPLRVLRDGAAWTYRGIDQPHGAAAAPSDFIAYTDTVTHAASGAGVTETGSNPFNGGPDTTSSLRFEGGAYKYSEQLAFVQGAPAQAVEVTELRSPVRVNDQYVSFDKHIADSGSDLDGDKINEQLDMAQYARVIGEETLDLPNRRQVKAVRVDMVMRARVTYSKTGTASPVLEAVQSNWYAPGLGIVKSRMEVPGADPASPSHVATEILQNWDGLSEGLGNTATVAGVAPAASSLAGASLQYPRDVAGFDTHAVVATYIPGQPSAAGLALAQLDARGKVLAARSYTRAELFPAAQWFSEPRLLRIGSELRLLARTDHDGVSMVAFDATGQQMLRPAVTVLSDPQFGSDYEGTSYRVAADGDGFWLGWVRTSPAANSVYLTSLLLQHVDTNGQPLGAARTLVDPVSTDFSDFRVAVGDARVAASWKQGGLAPVRRLVLVDAASGALVTQRTLDSSFDACTHVDTLSLQPGIAMACWEYPMGPLGAARLDAQGNLVLSAGTSLSGDTLKAPWLTSLHDVPVFGGSAGQLIVSAGQQGKYWPEDSSDSGFTSIFMTSAGSTSPLASSEPVLLTRMAAYPVNVLAMVQLGNRMLLVGSDGSGYLNSTVVWLPK